MGKKRGEEEGWHDTSWVNEGNVHADKGQETLEGRLVENAEGKNEYEKRE